MSQCANNQPGKCKDTVRRKIIEDTDSAIVIIHVTVSQLSQHDANSDLNRKRPFSRRLVGLGFEALAATG